MDRENNLKKFNSHVNKLILSNKYKKVNIELILDNRLSINDKSIFISILYKLNTYRDFWTEIKAKDIMLITRISQPNQSRSISRLLELGYIETKRLKKHGTLNFKIEIPKKYIIILDDQIKNMPIYGRKKWITTLVAIGLSNNNNKVPTFEYCKNKMGGILSWRVWHKMKNNYGRFKDADIVNYNGLMFSNIEELL